MFLLDKIRSLCLDNDIPLSRQIPYTHHFDEHTLQSKGGRLIQFIRLSGLNISTLTDGDIDYFKEHRADLLFSTVDPDVNIYTHTIRRKRDVVPELGYMPGSFSESFNKAWAVKQSHVRINEIYITITMKPPGGVYGSLNHFLAKFSFRANKAAKAEYLDSRCEKLSNVTSLMVARLSQYYANRLAIQPIRVSGSDIPFSEPMSFLHYLVNACYLPIRLPRMNISVFLAQLRPFFHLETMTFRGLTKDRYGAILSIKEYSDETAPTMLDELMEVDHDFILTQSFAFIDRHVAIKHMKRQERYMIQSEDYSVTQCDEISEAMDDVTAGRYGFGYHHCSIMVLADDERDLSDGITAIKRAVGGLILVREDRNMEAAYLAQLPGNGDFIGRKELISTRNFASFSSFHNLPQGRRDGNYWGDYVCQLQTAQGGPFFFNFHTSSASTREAGSHIVGPPPANTTIIGQTGSGKTLLMNFLVTMSQKFNPRTIYLDKDRGVELLVRSINGTYMVVQPGNAGVNPLQLPDTPLNRSFLEKWFVLLLTSNGETITNEDRTIIQDVIKQVYSVLDKPLRRLCHVAPYFGVVKDGSLASRLAQWHSDGARAWLFDNEHDGISFSDGMTGFDLTYMLNDTISQNPFNLYLFHRINACLDGQPSIIAISEAWAHLRNSLAAEGLEDFLKTIRKKNGFVIFETQELEDAANSSIQSTIRSQTVTNIFLPDSKADPEVYRSFGLSDHEIGIVQHLDPTLHEFLIKKENTAVVVRLDMTGMDEYIAVLSSSTSLLNKINDMGCPDKWLPLLKGIA